MRSSRNQDGARRSRSNAGLLKFLVAVLAVQGVSAHAASFDCAEATSKTEQAICRDPKLSKLDEDIAASYTKLLASLDEPYKSYVRDTQRQWLRKRATAAYLDSEMEERAGLLQQPLFTLNGVTFLRLSGSEEPMYITSPLPGAAAYNQWVTKELKDIAADPLPDERLKSGMVKYGPNECCAVLDVIRSYVFDTVSPDFVSLHVTTSTNEDGIAHPIDTDTHQNWWLSRTGKVTAHDLFADPSYARIIVERFKRYASTDVPSVGPLDKSPELDAVLDPDSWGITATSLHITLVASRLGAPHDYPMELELPWTTFKGMVNASVIDELKKYPTPHARQDLP